MTERTQEKTRYSRGTELESGMTNGGIHDIREDGGSVEGTDSDTTG